MKLSDLGIEKLPDPFESAMEEIYALTEKIRKLEAEVLGEFWIVLCDRDDWMLGEVYGSQDQACRDAKEEAKRTGRTSYAVRSPRAVVICSPDESNQAEAQ